MSGRFCRVAAALVVAALGMLSAGCGMVFDARCQLLGVCDRPSVPTLPGTSGGPGARDPHVSVSGEVRTTDGLVASVEVGMDLYLGRPLDPAEPGGRALTSSEGNVTVTNTGTEENLPITTLGYTVRMSYPADGVVCQAFASPSELDAACWIAWGADAQPFPRGGRYVPPLAVGASVTAELDPGWHEVLLPDDHDQFEQALRTPTTVVVIARLTSEGQTVAKFSPPVTYENYCDATSSGVIGVPVRHTEEPRTEFRVIEDWYVIAASSRPITCAELPIV